MLLSEVKKGDWVRIDKVLRDQLSSETDQSFVMRLLELGLKPGAKVCMRHVAPLGDPVSFEVNGSLVGMTKNQGRFFEVSEVSE